MLCYLTASEEPHLSDEAISFKKEIKLEDTNEIHVLQPAFRNKVILLLQECEKQGINVKVIETYRTPETQDKYKKRGVTTLSGGKSKHQQLLAIDIVPIVNGKMTWKNKHIWNKIGKIGESLGLTWGGRWKRLYDPGHFEMKAEETDIILIPFNWENV